MKKNKNNLITDQKITNVTVRVSQELRDFLEKYARVYNCDGTSSAVRKMIEFFAHKPESVYELAKRTGHSTLPSLLDVLLEHFMNQPTEEKIKILTWQIRQGVDALDNPRNSEQE
jgi:hypothetical protein